jgi:predicted site-specific integrase-resolvase
LDASLRFRRYLRRTSREVCLNHKNDRPFQLSSSCFTKSMIVALYARVSTRDKGQETENQLAELRTFAGKHDWTIFREYVDR